MPKRLADDLSTLPIVLASGYSHVLAQESAEGMELLRKGGMSHQTGEMSS